MNYKLKVSLHLIPSTIITAEGTQKKEHHAKFCNGEIQKFSKDLIYYLFSEKRESYFNKFLYSYFNTNKERTKVRKMVMKNLEFDTEFSKLYKSGHLFDIDVKATKNYLKYLKAFENYLNQTFKDILNVKLIKVKNGDKKEHLSNSELCFKLYKQHIYLLNAPFIRNDLKKALKKSNSFYNISSNVISAYRNTLSKKFKQLDLKCDFTFIYEKDNADKIYKIFKFYYDNNLDVKERRDWMWT